MEKICLIYTTIASQKDAETLAEKIVEKGLAVCVNLIPGALSVYKWEEKIEKSSECLMIFKTEVSKKDELQAYIIENHPYSLPAILTGDVKASPDFYEYVRTTLK